MIIPFKIYYNNNFLTNLVAVEPNIDLELLATGTVEGDPMDPSTILSGLFNLFNHMPSELNCIVEPVKGATFRSMSVGDVVVLGENAWRCQNVGWCEMDSSYLPKETMDV